VSGLKVASQLKHVSVVKRIFRGNASSDCVQEMLEAFGGERGIVLCNSFQLPDQTK
jgi:hypothetical protein